MAAELAPGRWGFEKSENFDEYMKALGKSQYVISDNFDEYMKALGVSYPWRVIGNSAKPQQEISIKDGRWTIITSTPVTKVVIQFELNKEFDETTADGRKVKSTCTVHGNKLITDQRGSVDSVITRDFTKNSFIMTLAAKDVTCTRYYKRLS
ncbi:hypothetical protein RRG08_016519 [Elysia crispata]|uniref:Cytosolic fatty-acid binding proteins domain-containing protein n=1 Tax=Elysia crispata TaxID=231223 RepID=A0AAE1E3T3_9GAST|nr:hypothetical protein RRG08_016519 [Elysia crispata]